jgi:hypothetical protein
MKFYIYDPNIFEEECGKDKNFNSNDLNNLCIADLLDKYSDKVLHAKVFGTNSLEQTWEETRDLIIDYYEKGSRIIEDLFQFIPQSIDMVDKILSSYNYILKIEK